MLRKIKKLAEEYNPLVIIRRKKMRKALKNKDVTFLCPNCIGGIMFHDLGLQFKSPTVNLMMIQKDFLKFVLDMDRYLKCEFKFFKHDEYTCPCAKLDDITVHFTHYKSEKEAVDKWNSRVLRMNKDNMFIFLTERDGLTKSDIEKLRDLNVKGIAVFTANDYSDIEYTLQIQKYNSDGEVGNVLKKSIVNGSREYEKYFDFVKWFNEADGKNFNISPFVKK